MDSLNYIEKLADQDSTIITRFNELFENKRNFVGLKHSYNDLKSKLLKDGAKKSLHDTLELILNRCLQKIIYDQQRALLLLEYAEKRRWPSEDAEKTSSIEIILSLIEVIQTILTNIFIKYLI